MFNAFNKTAIAAAIAVSALAGTTTNASALSLELPPGVQLEQKCFQKPVKVTKYVKVARYGKWVTIPKTIIVHKTVCKNYYTQVSQNPPVAHYDHKTAY